MNNEFCALSRVSPITVGPSKSWAPLWPGVSHRIAMGCLMFCHCYFHSTCNRTYIWLVFLLRNRPWEEFSASGFSGIWSLSIPMGSGKGRWESKPCRRVLLSRSPCGQLGSALQWSSGRLQNRHQISPTDLQRCCTVYLPILHSSCSRATLEGGVILSGTSGLLSAWVECTLTTGKKFM